ncbi:hypothetical protein F7725_023694 [Dissostichus mawsoni]|uniref:Cadherin domain-containing protein n=1 Tax=Dissostichus mawsoni TaxID=36200 RepID=A0A7J5XY39_DISMA|nr:hypothetical protein F7725_023694 [Dissostichus mawsoni]
MMAWLQMWTIAITVLSVSLAVSDSHFPLVEAEQLGEVEIVKKETHPVLFRQKRDWIWNSLYVEEEKPAPNPYKIGQLKSSQRVDVKSFKIEGEGANTIFHVDNKGDLFVSRSLDREEKNAYHLTATMYDGNNQLIEDSGEFVVQVTDINDNTPVFPKTYNGSIMERSTIGVISCKTNTLDRETQSRFVLVVKAQDMRGMASGSTSTTSLEDRDEVQNKEPIFTIVNENSKMFSIELSPNKDGNLMLKQALDYETKSIYTFTVQVRETLRFPADNKNSAVTTAQVNIKVLDVDEAPLFSQPIYTFNVMEERMVNNIGSRTLDRELEATHMFQVKAQEEPSGLESFVKVNIIVQDVNDNKPELNVDEIFVIGTLRATDKDDQPASFTFSLANDNSNFSIRDYGNSTADIMVKEGPFNLDDPKDYSLDVRISDGGSPLQASITKLAIKNAQYLFLSEASSSKTSQRTLSPYSQLLLYHYGLSMKSFTPALKGNFENCTTDVEIMPAVLSSIFSLIPSPPVPLFWGKRALVMLDERHVRDSWPNKRDLG